MIKIIKKIHYRLLCFYVRFQKCKKCNKPINPKDGFWHWDNKYSQIGGYYHTSCGTIQDAASIAFQKELNSLFD